MAKRADVRNHGGTCESHSGRHAVETRFASAPAMLAHYFQIQERELKTKAVTDTREAVAVDVALLRSIPALPGEWLISGLVYDVATGLAEIVVPPTAVRAAPIRAA